jgi:hypothetical protein
MTTESEEIEVTQEKVEDLAEDADIDEKYVRNSMENQKVDQRYERFQYQYDNNEYESERSIGDIKKGIKFLGTTIYSIPTTPNFATVTDIRAPDDSNEIIINTETKYPSVSKEDIDKDIFSKEHRLDLSESRDKFIVDNVLDYVGANDPSELEDEKVPIVPDQDSSYNETPAFDYRFDGVNPDMTIFNKSKRKLLRYLMRLNCLERTTKFWNVDGSKGEFKINKNIYLYLILILNVINYTTSIPILSIITTNMIFVFALYISIYICFGLFELFMRKEGNREFVEIQLNK